LDCWPIISTKFPIARFTSIRCRPQFARMFPPVLRSPVMSSTRGSDGFPCTVTSRYVAYSFDAQRAVKRPGTLPNGVVIGCSGTTHGLGGPDDAAMVRPSVER